MKEANPVSSPKTLAVAQQEAVPATSGNDPLRWVERYGDALYRRAIFRVGERGMAEDLVQETLLAAWIGRRSFIGNAQEKTWLMAILEHKIADHFRYRQRHPVLQSDDREDGIEEMCFGDDGTWSEPPKDWARDPAYLAENEETRKAVIACVERLPPVQRDAFLLREWQGEEIGTCALTLGVTANHLSVLLHRARLAISRCLEWYFPQCGRRA
jgi:RNA polymerase sigma-70 factor (ECF subfamily)